jgi:hypothetical protein
MADLTNAQKAPLLVDGEPIDDSHPGLTSSDPSVATVANGGDGNYWVIGQAPGSAVISLSYQARSGSLAVTVSEAPYVLTLGAAEPK